MIAWFGCGARERAGPAAAVEESPLAIACGDDVVSVYRTRADLGAMTPAERGRVVACARGERVGGARVLRIAYRTERLAGQAGVGTAMVFLPDRGGAEPRPWVVVAHGTIGLADQCAPSRQNGAFAKQMALPLVTRGYAVIAPDYSGLGNGHGQTVQGWGIAEDQAHSVLDAARALRRLLGDAALTRAGALVGHSQGGGAVMAAQAAARDYGAGVDVATVIAFAPGWYDARIFGRLLANPARRTGGGFEHELLTAFHAMWFFGHAAVYDGMARAAEPFAAGVRKAVRRAMKSRCIVTLGRELAAAARTVGELYDPGFAASVSACATGGACDQPGQTWRARVDADRPALDAAGAPIVVIEGLADPIVTPVATRCTVDALAAAGVKVRACTDAGADHFTILDRQAELAADTIAAALRGKPAPPCTSALPVCAPTALE